MRVLCVFNRALSLRDFWQQFKLVLAAKPEGVILRAKKLSEREYYQFAATALEQCRVLESEVKLILHNHPQVAFDLDCPYIHLPYQKFVELSATQRKKFALLGVSIHSLDEALYCEENGADYLLAGNIYETASKPGLAGKGLAYLSELVEHTKIPIFGIGGIRPGNVGKVLETGAAGVALMEPFMRAESPQELIKDLEKGSRNG